MKRSPGLDANGEVQTLHFYHAISRSMKDGTTNLPATREFRMWGARIPLQPDWNHRPDIVIWIAVTYTCVYLTVNPIVTEEPTRRHLKTTPRRRSQGKAETGAAFVRGSMLPHIDDGQPPVQPSRHPPVPVPKQLHRRWHQQRTDDCRIDRHGEGDTEAQCLDDHHVCRHE